MRFTAVCRNVIVALCVAGVPVLAQTVPDAGTDTVPSAVPLPFQLLRVQAELIQQAESAYHARVVSTLPGWSETVRDVERRTRLRWHGLASVILLVPDRGRGFPCADREDTCLGRYEGVLLKVVGRDSSAVVMSSLILIAESARFRPDVWAHELTHALLSQYGLTAESQRHDRRYFSEERFVKLDY
jgi:hypothetical protein